MEEKEEEYKGFWKNVGCILSVVAILGIITVLVIGAYMWSNGF